MDRNAFFSCEYRQGGSLQLASSTEEEQELIESADLLLEDGFEAELLYGDELGEPYLSAGFQTGIILPEDGEIHPASVVQHVVHKCLQQRCNVVYTDSQITQIDSSDGVHLLTESGSIKAHMAVLCTNAYLPKLIPKVTMRSFIPFVDKCYVPHLRNPMSSNALFMRITVLIIGVRKQMDVLCLEDGGNFRSGQ